MKKVLLFCFTAVLWSCNKEDDTFMKYIHLNNAEVKYNQPQLVDVDGDHVADYNFSTVLIGSTVAAKMQFSVSSTFSNRLLLSETETPALSYGDEIKYAGSESYAWSPVGNAVLTERIETDGQITWEGNWTHKGKKYLPIQVGSNGQYYNGWIEITVDSENEKVVLHNAALAKKATANALAGH